MTHSAPNANAMWPAAWPSGMVSARSVRGSIRSRLSAGAAPVELANAQMLSLLAASRAWVTAGTSSREVTRLVAGSIRTIPAAVQAQTASERGDQALARAPFDIDGSDDLVRRRVDPDDGGFRLILRHDPHGFECSDREVGALDLERGGHAFLQRNRRRAAGAGDRGGGRC